MSIPETVQSENGKGRMAIAVMIHTDAGWRFLRAIGRRSSSVVAGRSRSAARRAGVITAAGWGSEDGHRTHKKLVVRTAWALAGAKLYMPVEDPKLIRDLRALENDDREVRTVDVICAEVST